MSNTAERQFSLDQVSRAEGDKEQHRIISRLTFFFLSPHSSFINSALGAGTAGVMCGELQMCVGDKAGSVLNTFPERAEGAAAGGSVAPAWDDGRVMGR